MFGDPVPALQALLAVTLIIFAMAAIAGRHIDLLAWSARGVIIISERIRRGSHRISVFTRRSLRRTRRATRRRPSGGDGGGWRGGR